MNLVQFPAEDRSNEAREIVACHEPKALRTFTPSQAVIEKSAGCFHWTADGRRLYDYSSGVLVANLGHNPKSWTKRFLDYMGWTPEAMDSPEHGDYLAAVASSAYNAITPLEAAATGRLVDNISASLLGQRLDCVAWSASGSEAVQKALWCCLEWGRPQGKDVIVATRHGFHGKKGLAGAVTGDERDPDRDPRVRFVSFPREEIDDVAKHGSEINLSRFADELDELYDEVGDRLCCLITEPYLGGGGSYHPPAEYLQLLEEFCREHDMLFVLDEVQSNFGRTGRMWAFEKYGLEPDFVCLGKGLGNGIPVSAAVGPSHVMGRMKYGALSDTWSASPVSCAAVLATLDEFEESDVLDNTLVLSRIFFEGLAGLKETGVIAKVRGEGMVFGIECADVNGVPSHEVANHVVEAAYLGRDGGDGIHFLGPLAGNVLRVSPPMTMTEEQARTSLELLRSILVDLHRSLSAAPETAQSAT